MTIYTSFDEIPRGHYRLVVSDIPWGFRNKKTGGSGKSGASSHYPTVNYQRLKSLAYLPKRLQGWLTAPHCPEGQ